MTSCGFLYFISLIATISAQGCYYCLQNRLGHCTRHEIDYHKQFCPNYLPDDCHYTTYVKIHTEADFIFVQHCNQSVSTCERVLMETADGNLKKHEYRCCSRCTPNVATSLLAFSSFPIALTLLSVYLTSFLL